MVHNTNDIAETTTTWTSGTVKSWTSTVNSSGGSILYLYLRPVACRAIDPDPMMLPTVTLRLRSSVKGKQ